MKKPIKLDDIKPENELYKVDKTYFENLTQKIQHRTTAQEKTAFAKIWDIKFIRFGIPTALILGLFFGYDFQKNKANQITDNQLFTEVSSESLTSYLMEEDELDEELLMEYYAENQTEQFSDFSEVSEQTLEEQFADEDLEDYF